MKIISDTLAVAAKELRILLSERATLFVFFLMPLLFAMFFGQLNRMAAGDEAAQVSVDVALVNQDSGSFSERLVEALRQIDVLSIEELASPQAADEKVAKGEIVAAIVIPAGLSANIQAHTPSQIQVIVDPVKQEGASIVTGILNQAAGEVTLWGEVSYGVQSMLNQSPEFLQAPPEAQQAAAMQTLGVIMTQLDEARRSPAIAVSSEDASGVPVKEPFNPAAFNNPSMLTMFAFFLLGMMATSILTEKENGSFRRLLASPIRPAAILAGKTLAYMTIVVLQALLMLGSGVLFFEMPIGRSLPAVLLITLGLGFTASALGLLLATLARSAKQADSLGVVISLLLGGMGGCIALGSIFFRAKGTLIYYLSNLTPHAHALEGYMRLFGDNAGFVDVLPQIGILFGMGALYFVIALLRFKFD